MEHKATDRISISELLCNRMGWSVGFYVGALKLNWEVFLKENPFVG